MNDLLARLPMFDRQAPVLVGRQAVSGNSDVDTLATCGRMARIIALAAAHPAVHAAALEAVGNHPEKLDRRQLAGRVWSYVKNRVQFEQDEHIIAGALLAMGLPVAADAELLITPWQLLGMPKPMGDCDDFTMLAGSLLRAVGVPCSIVIIAADPAAPDDFSHVYLYAHLENGEAFAIDASHGPAAGWEAPRAFRRVVLPILAPMFRSTGLHGLPAGDALDRQVISGRTDQRLKLRPRDARRRRSGMGDITDTPGFYGTLGTSSIPSAGGVNSSDWMNLLSFGVKNIAAPILTSQFGGPKAGQFFQTGPGGTVAYALPQGSTGGVFSNIGGAGSSGMTTYIVLGIGALALVLIAGRH